MGADEMADGSGAPRECVTADGTSSDAPPRLVCLAASDRDRRDLETLLDSSGLAVTAASPPGSRAAILVGADAASSILTGGMAGDGFNGHESGSPSTAPMVIDAALPASSVMFDGMPPVADRAADPVPPAAGHFNTLATDHDRRVLASLTRREAEVAEFVGRGLNVEQIAERLRREKTTVISHRRSLLRKIGCRDALGIARFAYRVGLATP